MNLETRNHLKALVDSVAASVTGGLSFDQGAAGMLRGLDYLRIHFEAVDSEAKVLAILDSIEEPTPQQLQMIEVVASLLPAVITSFAVKSMKSAVADAPGERTGRKAMSDEEKTAICNRIGELVRSGNTFAIAKKRVAISTGKSLRTVNRIWGKRKEYVTGIGPEQVLQMFMSMMYGNNDGAPESSIKKLLKSSE